MPVTFDMLVKTIVFEIVLILVRLFSGLYGAIYIVYVIESAAYGVLFTSCLCQKPKQARYKLVRAFDTNNS